MANLRCYSCAPCTEFDYSSGWRDPGQWEMDCPLDRYCFKITGQVSNHWPSCCMLHPVMYCIDFNNNILLLDSLPLKAKLALQILILS